jgi:nucleotide-binding universal stress UspA family protein
VVQRIVVGTDGSETAERAVREAGELAKGTGASVHVVTAFQAPFQGEPFTGSAKQEHVDIRRAAETVAARSAEHVAQQGVKVDWEAREGDAAEVIIEVATEDGADLIVVGNKGMTGIGRFLLGNVPNKITHHAPCSVMVVRTS